MGEPFFKEELSMADRENLLWKIYGESSRQVTNDQIMQVEEEGRRFTNTFSSNLKTVNRNIFPNYGGI